MRKKVVIISETLMDGVGKHIVDVISHIDHEKYLICILHSAERIDYRFIMLQNNYSESIEFYKIDDMVREISFVSDLKAFFEINALIRKIKPDIVHCHSSKAGVLGRLASKLNGIPNIFYTPHAYAAQNQKLSPRKKQFYNLIETFLARTCTTLTVNVSDGEKGFAVHSKIHSASHFKVIYNCLPDVSVKPEERKKVFSELKNDPDEFLVGCVARLYTQKNPYLFIEIAQKVILKNPRIKFFWIGVGEQAEEIQNLVDERGLHGQVLLLGRRDHTEPYYEVMDLYLSTALYEGLPYTLIEALRSSCPIVASDVTGNNELVKQGDNGYLFDLENPERAAEYILKIFDDETLRAQMKKSSRSLYEEQFKIERMMAQYEELYGC